MLSLILALALAASTTVDPSSPAELKQTGASRVALASVTDPRNRPLVDVSADDFVIQEAGASREILSVRPADYPIVVLLDTGSEGRSDFALMQKAATHFIERVGQRPIAFGTFGGAAKMQTTFEDERQEVLAKLSAATAESGGGSLLLQGASLGGRTSHATGTLVSASVILAATPADASGSPADEMIAPIVDSNAILHVIADRPVVRGSDLDFRGRSPGDNRDPTSLSLRSNPALRALAEQSRGEFTVIYSASSYQAALDRLADRLTSEMLIEYLVPVGSKPNDVKVGIRIAGAKVRGLGVAPR